MKHRLLFLILILVSKTSFSQNSPLLQMQRDYDAVKLKISETRFEIKCLDEDLKAAKEIIDIMYSQLDWLDSSLTATKNYRDAELLLNKLKRLFDSDGAVKAMKKNYVDFKESETIRLDLVKNEKSTLKEFEEWKTKILSLYKKMGGAHYNYETESYNSIRDLIMKNP